MGAEALANIEGGRGGHFDRIEEGGDPPPSIVSANHRAMPTDRPTPKKEQRRRFPNSVLVHTFT